MNDGTQQVPTVQGAGEASADEEAFAASHADVAGAALLDVRREAAYQAATTRIAGALWKDPSAVESWAAELPTDRAIIVYCVYGHEVSRSAAQRLRAAGFEARFLRGGIDGWQAAGLPVEPKDAAS